MLSLSRSSFDLKSNSLARRVNTLLTLLFLSYLMANFTCASSFSPNFYMIYSRIPASSFILLSKYSQKYLEMRSLVLSSPVGKVKLLVLDVAGPRSLDFQLVSALFCIQQEESHTIWAEGQSSRPMQLSLKAPRIYSSPLYHTKNSANL